MPRANTKDYVDFILFWSWEYTKRNSPERGNYIKEKMVELDGEVSLYENSSDLLNSILAGNFKYKYINSDYKIEKAVALLYFENYGFDGYGDGHTEAQDRLRSSLDECGFGLSNHLRCAYSIDFTKPLNQILAEVKSKYVAQHSIAQKGYSSGHPIHEEAFGEVLRASSMIKRLPRRSDRNLPRAIGVWLWDYLQDRGYSIRQFAKAKNAFYDTYQGDNCSLHIDGYSDESQLKVLLAATDKCIKGKSVLPLA